MWDSMYQVGCSGYIPLHQNIPGLNVMEIPKAKVKVRAKRKAKVKCITRGQERRRARGHDIRTTISPERHM